MTQDKDFLTGKRLSLSPNIQKAEIQVATSNRKCNDLEISKYFLLRKGSAMEENCETNILSPLSHEHIMIFPTQQKDLRIKKFQKVNQNQNHKKLRGKVKKK